MTNVESIKQQIAEMESKLTELSSKIDEVSSTSGDYVFTKDELISFIKDLIDQAECNLRDQVRDIDFDNDCVELDLDSYSYCINVSIDSSSVADAVVNNIDLKNFDDDGVEATIEHLYKLTKNKRV